MLSNRRNGPQAVISAADNSVISLRPCNPVPQPPTFSSPSAPCLVPADSPHAPLTLAAPSSTSLPLPYLLAALWCSAASILVALEARGEEGLLPMMHKVSSSVHTSKYLHQLSRLYDFQSRNPYLSCSTLKPLPGAAVSLRCHCCCSGGSLSPKVYMTLTIAD